MITESEKLLKLLESVNPPQVSEDGLGTHFSSFVRDEVDNIHLCLSRIGKSLHNTDYEKDFSSMESNVLRALSQFRKKLQLGYGA